MSIKLPQPFSSIIHKEWGDKKYTIMEAYMDEIEHTNLPAGVLGLRALLRITGSESICDLFCKIQIPGVGERIIIVEHKDSTREGSVFTAKRQLENSHKLIKNKLGITSNCAILSGMPMEPPFKARKELNTSLKTIYAQFNGRSIKVNLEGTNIPLLAS